MMRAALLAAALIAGAVLGGSANAASAPQPASGSAVVPARPDAGLPGFAIVTQDNTALRAAPRDSAATQAVLWQGDALEVRGQRADYLQVYDHRRERAGYVRATQVRTTNLKAEDAPELLAVLRFVRELRGSEALGLAYSAAYLKAAPAGTATAEAFDAMGQMAERLAIPKQNLHNLLQLAELPDEVLLVLERTHREILAAGDIAQRIGGAQRLVAEAAQAAVAAGEEAQLRRHRIEIVGPQRAERQPRQPAVVAMRQFFAQHPVGQQWYQSQ